MRVFSGLIKWPVDTEKQELRENIKQLEELCLEYEATVKYWQDRYNAVVEALNYTEDSQQVEREEWWESLKGYAQ